MVCYNSNFSKANKIVCHKPSLPRRNPSEVNPHWDKENLVGSHSFLSSTSTYYSPSIWLWILENHFQLVILLLKKCKASLLLNSKFLCLAFKGLYHLAELSSAPTTSNITVPLLTGPITCSWNSSHPEYFPFPHIFPSPISYMKPLSTIPTYNNSTFSEFLLYSESQSALQLFNFKIF